MRVSDEIVAGLAEVSDREPPASGAWIIAAVCRELLAARRVVEAARQVLALDEDYPVHSGDDAEAAMGAETARLDALQDHLDAYDKETNHE